MERDGPQSPRKNQFDEPRVVVHKAFCIVIPREFSLQLKPTMAY
jgi:hypothetical protein